MMIEQQNETPMRFLILVFTLIISLTYPTISYSQFENNSENKLNNKSEADSKFIIIKYYKYDYDSGEGKVLVSTVTNEFDAEGRLIEKKHKFINQDIYTNTKYKYDNNDRMIESEVYKSNDRPYISYYTYDNNGYQRSCTEIYKDGDIRSKDTTICEYNYNNQIVIQRREDESGDFGKVVQFVYDSTDQLKYETWKYRFYEQIIKQVLIYNENEKISETKVFDKDDELTGIRRFLYNEDGNHAGFKDYNTDEELISFSKVEYDSEGRIKKSMKYEVNPFNDGDQDIPIRCTEYEYKDYLSDTPSK